VRSISPSTLRALLLGFAGANIAKKSDMQALHGEEINDSWFGYNI
jgi:hypothetical protein